MSIRNLVILQVLLVASFLLGSATAVRKVAEPSLELTVEQARPQGWSYPTLKAQALSEHRTLVVLIGPDEPKEHVVGWLYVHQEPGYAGRTVPCQIIGVPWMGKMWFADASVLPLNASLQEIVTAGECLRESVLTNRFSLE